MSKVQFPHRAIDFKFECFFRRRRLRTTTNSTYAITLKNAVS